MNRFAKNCLLSINSGSSSIKFAIYEIGESLHQLFSAEIKGIASDNANIHLFDLANGQKQEFTISGKDHTEVAKWIVAWLEQHAEVIRIKGIGHRIVQGMEHTKPQKITNKLLAQLKKISDFDPEHLPAEIKLIEVFKKHYPAVDQIACFDTAFHTSMPAVAKLIPIPKKFRNKGIKRYGFHGLSYAYLLEEFEQMEGTEKAKGRIIIAHLGSGASLAAIKNGNCLETSMGFTPASGLTMSTRTGDLDPGVAWHLQQFEKLTPPQFNHLVNHESGLLAISETTGDMEHLLKIQHQDARASAAIDFFCYQCIKWIGAFTAVLGGLDTLIFSGGIGEHSPQVRNKICDGLEFFGIELDEIDNMNNKTTISTIKSKTKVYMIHTNEELMIAKLVSDVLNNKIKKQK